MASSFIGASVHITLTNGEAFNAKILAIDPSTATLTIEHITGACSTLQRNELRDVRVINSTMNPSVSTNTNTANSSASPALRGGNGLQKPSSEKRKNRRKPKGDVTPPKQPTVPMEEFDFDKNLRNFDKKKIWEEISHQENTDSSSLLVSINRTETRQPMIAPNEMVLSNEEREADEAVTKESTQPEKTPSSEPPAASEPADSPAGATTEEVHQLRTQIALLEALTGIQLSADGDSWQCKVFADTRLSVEHWRSKHQKAQEPSNEGVLQFRLSAPDFGSESQLLSYDGPMESSDKELVSRLPDHFQRQINIKVDNATLFQQRITDCIRQQ